MTSTERVDERVPAYSWYALGVLFVVYLVNFVDRQILSILANDIKADLHIGDAQKIIPEFEETWDLVFIDADKVNYINYYELTLPSIRQGGWILADNVLFHGEVLE